MASSAQQGFVDPYDYNFSQSLASAQKGLGLNDPNEGLMYSGSSGLVGFARKFFGDDLDYKKQIATTRAQQEYERASINSARAWSEYMDSTQYQRKVEDLKKAGLNPWLAVQNGISGSGAPSVDTGGSAKNQTKSDQSLSGLATLLMAIAKIVA